VDLPNVYLREDVVERFARMLRYDGAALDQVAADLQQQAVARGQRTLSLLDVGIGDGGFTVPVLAYLERTGVLDYHLNCLDVSPHMLSALEAALSAHSIPGSRVKLLLQDARQGLGEHGGASIYDAAIVTFVLQYVEKWRGVMDDVVRALKDGGILLQAEIAGEMKLVDGMFDTDSSPEFKSFWREYFRLRSEFCEFNPPIRVSDLSLVRQYIEHERCLEPLMSRVFLWDRKVKWLEMCNWIQWGPVSSLGSGLDGGQMAVLADRMRAWVAARFSGADPDYTMRWGFEITWHRKCRHGKVE